MRGDLIPVEDDEVLVARHMTVSTGYLHGEASIALHVDAENLDGNREHFVLMVGTDDAEWLSDVLERVTVKVKSGLN